ncbi:MAG TPA: tRNA preQ1(34) S-adenosylmethionine ribosyltransferase-isomerase QueA, partial [Ktedonobacterales bacterium]
LLVANASKVLPARLKGVKEGTGGQTEVLLLAARPDLGTDVWEALVNPGRRTRPGHRVTFDDGALHVEVLDYTPFHGRIVRLSAPDGEVATALTRIGQMPLPPYITAPLEDPTHYQTVYAHEPGSAAAPTAGLHFTPELLTRLRASGVGAAFVTLHIGLDTFRPVEVERLDEHKMHSEAYSLDAQTARAINEAHAGGGRIVAVGTTSVRVLETAAEMATGTGQIVVPCGGRTSIFIQPGHHFGAVDALITNFHLPKSTLLVLVSAFASRELMLHAYEVAVKEGYRFYSFGDAMLIL